MLGEPEADRPSTAPADLAHPRHLGTSLAVRRRRHGRPRRDGSRSRTRRHRDGRAHRRTRTAPPAVAYVPGTGRPSGTLCRYVRLVLNPSAPARIASSSRSHIVAEVVAGGRCPCHAALAHHVLPERAVTDHAADVHALGHAADGLRGTRRTSPSPTAGRRGSHRAGCPRRSPSARRDSVRSSGLHGANVTPQLPITTLVTPWKQLLLAIGSHASCASRWVWMSTKPGRHELVRRRR